MSCEAMVRRLTISDGHILTPESTAAATDWRALSQSVHSVCLPPDRDRRSSAGNLAGGGGRVFELNGAYGVRFAGSGFIDMASHLWRSNLRSLHRTLRVSSPTLIAPLTFESASSQSQLWSARWKA